jgi:hypothetical protein
MSRRDAEGFSSCFVCPCPHAVASHPAGVDRRVSQSATTHAAFAFTVAGSASGSSHFRGHLCVRLRYGLETCPHPKDEAVERLQKVGFPSPCSPSDRALTFPLVGFPPTEHTSLRWTHNRTCDFHRIRLASFLCSLPVACRLPQSWMLVRNVSALRISRTLTSLPAGNLLPFAVGLL